MSVLVQKFGGTSVADAERIERAARRVALAKADGNDVVVVVSARGHQTDELIATARQINPQPPSRELDALLATGEMQSAALMAMALHRMGVEAESLAGVQTGILTDGVFTRARIENIDPKRVKAVLGAGRVAIVAGFQGVDANGNITTLGRGASDTTAVAVAAALSARVCEIYTDVDGVYTADPRIVPTARRIPLISYDEMLELASLGAGVLHGRCVEVAKKYGVTIHVRSTFTDAPGTMVVEEVPAMEKIVVSGATVTKDEAKITLRRVPDQPGVAAQVFEGLSVRNVVVDMIVQTPSQEGATDLSFTVPEESVADAMTAASAIGRRINAANVECDDRIAKVSVVGVGMRSHTGVAAKMFKALADAGVNIQMIATSEIKISCIIDEASADPALRAVHAAFDLHAERGQT
jgi:aspartate kinase